MLYNHLFDRMDKLRVFGKEMADYLENSLGAKLEQEYSNLERSRGGARGQAAEGAGEQSDAPSGADAAYAAEQKRAEKQSKRKVGRLGQKKHAGEQQESVLAALSDQEMEALLGELAASVSERGGLGKDQEIIDEILKEYLS